VSKYPPNYAPIKCSENFGKTLENFPKTSATFCTKLVENWTLFCRSLKKFWESFWELFKNITTGEF
jgi:hypothetical protein